MSPLQHRFPALFAICTDPMQLVASALSNGSRNISFRRTFDMAEAAAWTELQSLLPPSLPGGRNLVSWRLTPSGMFSVKSAYRCLFGAPVRAWTSPLWKAPIPLKIKIFVWQLLRNRLPSGVEVRKRQGPGDGLCPLCGIPETGTHILFTCPAARFLWNFVHEALGPAWRASDLGEFLEIQANRTGERRRLFWLVFAALTWTLWTVRNKMVIERIFVRRASDLMFKLLAFLQQWHPLSRQQDRGQLDDMLASLLETVRQLSSLSST